MQPISPEPPELAGRVLAGQQWRSLAFLHWRVDSAAVAPLLPAGLRPDEFDGSSWVGLIGFMLEDATLGPSPAIPSVGSFAEINVRLYAVDAEGRRGVVFSSLEASRLAAVVAARVAFSIPYFWSRTSMVESSDTVAFTARRHSGPGESDFGVRWHEPLEQDDLAEFLTARWGLFTRRFGRTVWLPNTHDRWELHRATVTHLSDTLIEKAGLTVTGAPESVLYSPGVRARFGRAVRLAR